MNCWQWNRAILIEYSSKICVVRAFSREKKTFCSLSSTYVPFETCPCVSFDLFLKCFTIFSKIYDFQYLRVCDFVCLFCSATKNWNKNVAKCSKGSSVTALQRNGILIFFRNTINFPQIRTNFSIRSISLVVAFWWQSITIENAFIFASFNKIS